MSHTSFTTARWFFNRIYTKRCARHRHSNQLTYLNYNKLPQGTVIVNPDCPQIVIKW